MVGFKQTNTYVTVAALVAAFGFGANAEGKTSKHYKMPAAAQATPHTPEARVQLDRACKEQNHAKSCLELGDMATVWKKPARALAYYDLGCDLNNYNACVKSADGYLLTKQGEEARKDLTKACKIAGAENCSEWGIKLVREKRYAEAPRFLDMGCNGGNEQACFALATIKLSGSAPATRQVASATFEKSCRDDADGWSCAAVGKLEESKGNKYRAKKMFRQACDLNSARGCLYLSQITAREKEFDESRTAAKRACELGDKNGCTVLGRFANFDGSRERLRSEVHSQCQEGDRASCNLMSAYTQGGMKGTKAAKGRGVASAEE